MRPCSSRNSFRTFDNELVTVSGSTQTDSEVTNPVAHDRLRLTQTFSVSRNDVDEVVAVLAEEAAANPDVLTDPEPTVRATDLGPESISLQVRFWIANPERADFVAVRSAFIRSVNSRFEAEGVELVS